MRTLVELIQRYGASDPHFGYYVALIEEAQRNESDHPDIAIECCVSLFQGIAKTIVYRLDPPGDRKDFEGQNVTRQISAALKCLTQHDDIIEIEFSRRVHSLVQVLGELRNARGDISHGRAAPKELRSDRSLSRLALEVTEATLRYMLASFFAIRAEGVVQVEYESNGDFNEYLDQQHVLPGKPLYSLALYQQYYEDYVIRLKQFDETEPDEGGIA